MSITNMWTVIFILLVGGITDAYDIYPLNKSMVQMIGERQCRALGHGWELPMGIDIDKNLTSLMILHKFLSIWLGVQRRKLSRFQWVNGQPSQILDPLKTDKGCASLSLQHVILPHVCADETSGFICEFTECPRDILKGAECIVSALLNYTIICDAQNWYKARMKCRSYGGRLAILDNNLKIEAVMRHMGENAHKWSSCLSFYIGLHCEDWTVYHAGEYKAVDTDMWDDQQPSNGHYDCVKLVLNKEGQARWHTENCHDRNPVICQKYNDSDAKNATADINMKLICSNNTAEGTKCEKLPECTGEKAKTIFLAVFVPLVCLIALVVSAITATRKLRKHRKKQGNQEPATEARESEEEEESLVQETSFNVNNGEQNNPYQHR